MELIKKLTGKNPQEYESATKLLVNNADIELFKMLVQQDDFLFDFIKTNVARHIQQACNENNYKNLYKFLTIYSPTYDLTFAEIFHRYGDENTTNYMQEMFYNGSNAEKAYATKYFLLYQNSENLIEKLREYAKSDFEPLAINSIEILAKLNDNVSKNEAIEKLHSADEFEQYEAIKFLVMYDAKDCINEIIATMKKSSFAENIASEIPYLISPNELLNSDYENGLLVMCNIISAIPEIISPSAVCDYELYSVFENILSKPLESSSAVVLRLAKEKFEELTSNEEYLYDSDKNTKDEIASISELLSNLNNKKLNSYLYDELYEESDFVFFALDFVDEIEELEALLESDNQTLVLKVLTRLKDKGALAEIHKTKALKHLKAEELKNVALAL
ncbi:MAG: hypothetical protein MJ237_02155 [bacterium]|nr:hypothetical protein [bacterium]